MAGFRLDKPQLRQQGCEVDMCLGVPGKIVEVSHEEVIKVANEAEKKMTLLMKELISSI